MKKLVFLLLFTAITLYGRNDQHYSQIRIPLSLAQSIVRLASLGLAVEEAGGRRGQWIDLFVNEHELAALRREGILFEVLIDDWDAYYTKRQSMEKYSGADLAAASAVKNFHLGTMGGMLTFQEAVAELDSMKKKYPLLISSRDSIGRSIEGRPIWAVKISKNPSLSGNEPKALYTALHHAREGAGLMTVIYYMWYLLENYGSDPVVTSILDHRELHFIPVVNPDGYAYNQFTNSSGGGMWRKNRKPTSDTTWGVDLNRNYGYMWGYDNIGSSGNQKNDTYRGTAGFSEPEIQAVRNYCNREKFSVALNYHTYSNLLIYPWGYSDMDSKDSVTFRRMGVDMTAVNRNTYGTGGQTVGYVTNGDSDDWMYGDTLQKPKIYSMTPEIGSIIDTFWPLTSRILPLASINLSANLYFSQVAGSVIGLRNGSLVPSRFSGDTLSFSFFLENKGVQQSVSPVTVHFKSADVIIIDSSMTNSDWIIRSAPYTVRTVKKSNIVLPPIARIIVTVDDGAIMTSDTVSVRTIQPTELYNDDTETKRSDWISTSNIPSAKWDTTRLQARSGKYSYAASPAGAYPNSLNSSFTLNKQFTLGGSGAELHFWMMWDIEPDYDYAKVQISTDGGTAWQTLSGKFTKDWAASGGYFGIRHDWVEEVLDLQKYVGSTVKLRFTFYSDSYETRRGFFIDDIRLLLYPNAPDAVVEEMLPYSYRLDQNYPNPFNPSTTIQFVLAERGRTALRIYDLLGREVSVPADKMMEAGEQQIEFDASRLATGVYFYKLTSGNYSSVKKMLLIR